MKLELSIAFCDPQIEIVGSLYGGKIELYNWYGDEFSGLTTEIQKFHKIRHQF